MKDHRSSLLLAWLGTTLLSFVVGFGIFLGGKAGDCKPGEIDGQCGLSTFVGLLYGVAAGLLIFLSSTICCLVIRHRRRKAEDGKS